MANKILIKRSGSAGGVPTTGQLDLAELAINTFDGRLFAKKDVSGTTSVVDLTRNDPIRVLGDASSAYAYDQSTYTSNVTVTLNTVNSTTGSFGGKSNGVLTIPIVTVNDKGLVTAVTTTTFSAGGDFGNMSTQNADNVNIIGGNINGTTIGATTRAAGSFTSVTTTNDVVVGGNLVVQGTTTTVNSTTVAIGDLNIELAKDATSAGQANGAGITINGPVTPATITYQSSDDSWNFNKMVNGGVANFSSVAVSGNVSAGGLVGTIFPDGGNGENGIIFPSNPGGGNDDTASIKYYVASGERGVLELKVTNDSDADPSGSDIIRLNASGGTYVNNQLVADAIISNAAVTAGSISTTGTLAAGATTLGQTSATAINSTPIGDVTPSTGAFTTGNFTQSLNSAGNLTVATNKVILRSDNGDIITTGNIFVANGAITVKDLTITGTTSLGSVSAGGVTSTQIVYAGSDNGFKGEGVFTYNDSTKLLSVGNMATTGFANIGTALVVGTTADITGAVTLGSSLAVTGTTTLTAAVTLNSTATFTAGSYNTGAFKLAGDGSIAGKLQVSGAIYKGGYEVLSTADTIDGGTF